MGSLVKNFVYLMGIILATIFFFKSSSPVTDSRKFLDKFPQEYMKNVKVTNYTDDGILKDKIDAKFWAYLPKEQISQIVEPRISVIKPDNSVWTVNARYGIANHPSLQSKVEKLELKERVVIIRPEALDIAPIKLTTEQLFYYPEKEYVQTDMFVKMVKPGLQITGTGLEGYLDKNWLELQKNVKTTYISSS